MSALKVAQIPELMDMIIDHLHSDHLALMACSMACRGLLPSSRSRLFHSLNLRQNTSQTFLRLLESPFTTIPPYVRSLRIFESWTHSGLWQELGSGWMDSTLPHLTYFVGVRSLWLSAVCWDDLGAESRNALISFQQVTQLSFFQTIFDSFQSLVDLLCSYPLLEHICFNNFWPRKPWGPTTKSLPASLRHLDLGHISKEHFIGSLLSCHCAYAVDTVYLSSITVHEIRPIAAFLRNLGHNLHHLRIDLFTTWGVEIGVPILFASPNLNGVVSSEPSYDIIDLVHNDQLRSIRLCDQFHTGTRSPDQIAGILSRIVSDHMELVELAICGTIDLIDWWSIAKVFAKPQFAALSSIRITVSELAPQDVAGVVRKALPDCDARGILDFPTSFHSS